MQQLWRTDFDDEGLIAFDVDIGLFLLTNQYQPGRHCGVGLVDRQMLIQYDTFFVAIHCFVPALLCNQEPPSMLSFAFNFPYQQN